MKRIRLTKFEISAILSVAGNADAVATFEDIGDEKEEAQQIEYYESGMEKLREMLERLS